MVKHMKINQCGIYHINRNESSKSQDHFVVKKALTEIQHPFMIRTLNKLEKKELTFIKKVITLT